MADSDDITDIVPDTVPDTVTIEIEPFSADGENEVLGDYETYYNGTDVSNELMRHVLSQCAQRIYENEIAGFGNGFAIAYGDFDVYPRVLDTALYYVRMQYREPDGEKGKVCQRYLAVRPQFGVTTSEEMFVSENGEESMREVNNHHFGYVLFDIKETADAPEDLVLSASFLENLTSPRHYGRIDVVEWGGE